MFPMLRFHRIQVFVIACILGFACGLAAAAPKAYVANFKDDTVSVIDTAAGKVLKTIPVAAGPHGMVVSADGRWLYVSGDGSSKVDVIDTTTDKVTRSIEVGKSPHGNRLTPDGTTLLVAVNGEDKVAFVDTGTLAVVASTDVGKPHTVAITPDGKRAYVTSQVPGHFALVVIELVHRTVVGSIALEKPPRDLEFDPRGRALYFTEAGVNAVQVLDPSTDKIVAEIPTGASPHIASVFPHVALGMVVVQGPGELLLFDPATNKPVRSIKVGTQPHWVAVSRDGKTAYVPNEGSNDVSVVNLASGSTTAIAVGNAPRKVVLQP